MALIRSLTSGSTALKANQAKMDVISNNIANVNTSGFKGSKMTFVEQFNQTMALGNSPNNIAGAGTGGVDPQQIGLGVKVGSVKIDFAQGATQVTSRPLDLSLSSDGFFVLRTNGQTLYSRGGAMSFDADGNLVDGATGAYLQGYNVATDSTGKTQKDANNENILNRALSKITVPPSSKSQPRQTQSTAVQGNLNSQTAIGDSVETSITIFDSQGTGHIVQYSYVKTATLNQWSMTASIDGQAIADIDNVTAGAQATSLLTFNQDGTLASPLSLELDPGQLNTALGTFPFATTTKLKLQLTDANNLLNGITQFSGQNTVSANSQDGYTAGDLARIQVDPTGRIKGSYTNGKVELLGQVVLAKFTNPSGLLKEGGNYFSVSGNSGLPIYGTALEIFPSTSVLGGSLEESNVDLSEQFTDMISTQRAFEAAARIISTSDQFLQEINQLKR